MKEDLLLLPSLPRVLGPEEEITVPVTVFGLRDGIGDVEVTLTATPPLEIVGARRMTLTFTKTGEQDVYFQLRAQAEVGSSHVTIRASSGSSSFSSEEDLPVARLLAPRLRGRRRPRSSAGRSVRLQVPSKGMRGTNEATVRVSRLEELSIDHRLAYLDRVPLRLHRADHLRGLPAALPQVPDEEARLVRRGDRQEHQRGDRPAAAPSSSPPAHSPSGRAATDGLGVGHELRRPLPARSEGRSATTCRQTCSRAGCATRAPAALTTAGDLMERVYRVMLLSLAGEPSVAGMNFLKENSLKDMNDTMKWTLAAAYRLRGMDSAAAEVLRGAGTKAMDYLDYGSSYGSRLRDQGMILEKLVLFQRWQEARDLYEEIAPGARRHRTGTRRQTIGYALLALGKYVTTLTQGQDVPLMQGRIQLPGGQSVSFSTRELSITESISSGFGEPVTVTLDASSTITRAYVTLSWSLSPAPVESGGFRGQRGASRLLFFHRRALPRARKRYRDRASERHPRRRASRWFFIWPPRPRSPPAPSWICASKAQPGWISPSAMA